uniref:C2H2-type domain-containing protein n=1 Tax=Riboviria sp. TaxID=2585031 RepID=A0A8K1U440_9VIRU|nr:MAG: hypothetical protein 2 [Riboviria sp.]
MESNRTSSESLVQSGTGEQSSGFVRGNPYEPTVEEFPVFREPTLWLRWRYTILKWISVLAAGFAAGIIATVVTYRWVKRGYERAVSAVSGGFDKLNEVIDAISPGEEKAQEEKVSLVQGVFVAKLQEWAGKTVWTLLEQLSPMDWTILLLGAITTASALWYSFYSLGRVGKRTIQRFRGIRFESVREGSLFRKADIPPSQVSVMTPGVLMDTHLGFGIRFGDYLVLPRHVVTSMGELMPTVLLKGPKGKVYTELSAVRSRVIDDLVYAYVDANTWSLLGVARAKLSPKTLSCHAVCTGLPGQSTGRITKTQMRWIISYLGSTLPGMSGAAYMDGNTVVGIHQGASGLYNVGVSSELICAEMKKICVRESMEEDVREQRPQFFSKGETRVWDGIKAMEHLDNVYKSDWHNHDEIDYNQQLDFGESSPTAGPSKSRVSFEIPEGSINIRPHGVETENLAYLPAEHADYVGKLRGERLLERVQKLEQQVAELVSIPAKPLGPLRFKCDRCDTTCRTEKRLHNHVESAHYERKNAEVQPESAHAADFRKSVKTGHFLERPRRSAQSSRSSSPRASISSGRKTRSLAQEESLSSMMASQKSIEKCLKELLKHMAGPASEAKQS